jgi:hypothetical protein
MKKSEAVFGVLNIRLIRRTFYENKEAFRRTISFEKPLFRKAGTATCNELRYIVSGPSAYKMEASV